MFGAYAAQLPGPLTSSLQLCRATSGTNYQVFRKNAAQFPGQITRSFASMQRNFQDKLQGLLRICSATSRTNSRSFASMQRNFRDKLQGLLLLCSATPRTNYIPGFSHLCSPASRKKKNPVQQQPPASEDLRTNSLILQHSQSSIDAFRHTMSKLTQTWLLFALGGNLFSLNLRSDKEHTPHQHADTVHNQSDNFKRIPSGRCRKVLMNF